MFRLINSILIASLILTPIPSFADEGVGFALPKPGEMVPLSEPFSPAVLKGIKLDPKDPFCFHFYVDKGDMSSPSAFVGDPEFKQESQRLIKYFLASLTIPEKDLWVNLSPYEKDRIIPEAFGQTEMGRDLLAQDYILKQITASLIYPESQMGKQFWDKVYKEAQAKYGTTDIPINTFNKVWIMPEKAVVYENNGVVYVLENHLKVMLEQDYLALQKGAVPDTTNAIGSQVVREIVIPALTKEVNEGKNFAQLRQVFYSLILATWYKKKIKDSILNKVYSDQKKTSNLSFPKASIGNPEHIYQQYLQAFKKGVFNYIKDLDPTNVGSGATSLPRKYFSGGVIGAPNIKYVTFAMISPEQTRSLSQAQLTEVEGKVNFAMTKTEESGAKANDEAMKVSEALSKYFQSPKNGSIAVYDLNSKQVWVNWYQDGNNNQIKYFEVGGVFFINKLDYDRMEGQGFVPIEGENNIITYDKDKFLSKDFGDMIAILAMIIAYGNYIKNRTVVVSGGEGNASIIESLVKKMGAKRIIRDSNVVDWERLRQEDGEIYTWIIAQPYGAIKNVRKDDVVFVYEWRLPLVREKKVVEMIKGRLQAKGMDTFFLSHFYSGPDNYDGTYDVLLATSNKYEHLLSDPKSLVLFFTDDKGRLHYDPARVLVWGVRGMLDRLKIKELRILLEYDSKTVDALSINSIVGLGVPSGAHLVIHFPEDLPIKDLLAAREDLRRSLNKTIDFKVLSKSLVIQGQLTGEANAAMTSDEGGGLNLSRRTFLRGVVAGLSQVAIASSSLLKSAEQLAVSAKATRIAEQPTQRFFWLAADGYIDVSGFTQGMQYVEVVRLSVQGAGEEQLEHLDLSKDELAGILPGLNTSLAHVGVMLEDLNNADRRARLIRGLRKHIEEIRDIEGRYRLPPDHEAYDPKSYVYHDYLIELAKAGDDQLAGLLVGRIQKLAELWKFQAQEEGDLLRKAIEALEKHQAEGAKKEGQPAEDGLPAKQASVIEGSPVNLPQEQVAGLKSVGARVSIEPVDIGELPILNLPKKTIFVLPLTREELKGPQVAGKFADHIINANFGFPTDLSFEGTLSVVQVRLIELFREQALSICTALKAGNIDAEALRVLLKNIPAIEVILKDLTNLRRQMNLPVKKKEGIDGLVRALATFIKSIQLLQFAYHQWEFHKDYLIQPRLFHLLYSFDRDIENDRGIGYKVDWGIREDVPLMVDVLHLDRITSWSRVWGKPNLLNLYQVNGETRVEFKVANLTKTEKEEQKKENREDALWMARILARDQGKVEWVDEGDSLTFRIRLPANAAMNVGLKGGRLLDEKAIDWIIQRIERRTGQKISNELQKKAKELFQLNDLAEVFTNKQPIKWPHGLWGENDKVVLERILYEAGFFYNDSPVEGVSSLGRVGINPDSWERMERAREVFRERKDELIGIGREYWEEELPRYKGEVYKLGPALTQEPKASLLIVSLIGTRYEALLKRLDEISLSGEKADTEIIVTIADKENFTLEKLEAIKDKAEKNGLCVTVVVSNKNTISTNRNLAASLARGQYFVFLDDDVSMVGPVIQRLGKALEDYPELGIVSLPTYNKDSMLFKPIKALKFFVNEHMMLVNLVAGMVMATRAEIYKAAFSNPLLMNLGDDNLRVREAHALGFLSGYIIPDDAYTVDDIVPSHATTGVNALRDTLIEESFISYFSREFYNKRALDYGAFRLRIYNKYAGTFKEIQNFWVGFHGALLAFLDGKTDVFIFNPDEFNEWTKRHKGQIQQAIDHITKNRELIGAYRDYKYNLKNLSRVNPLFGVLELTVSEVPTNAAMSAKEIQKTALAHLKVMRWMKKMKGNQYSGFFVMPLVAAVSSRTWIADRGFESALQKQGDLLTEVGDSTPAVGLPEGVYFTETGPAYLVRDRDRPQWVLIYHHNIWTAVIALVTGSIAGVAFPEGSSALFGLGENIPKSTWKAYMQQMPEIALGIIFSAVSFTAAAFFINKQYHARELKNAAHGTVQRMEVPFDSLSLSEASFLSLEDLERLAGETLDGQGKVLEGVLLPRKDEQGRNIEGFRMNSQDISLKYISKIRQRAGDGWITLNSVLYDTSEKLSGLFNRLSANGNEVQVYYSEWDVERGDVPEDKAMNAKGGIDLNPAQMDMQVKNEGEGFKFDFNGVEIDAAQITGAEFIINEIKPVTNLLLELGLLG